MTSVSLCLPERTALQNKLALVCQFVLKELSLLSGVIIAVLFQQQQNTVSPLLVRLYILFIYVYYIYILFVLYLYIVDKEFQLGHPGGS